jgi:hypothetical protein
MRLLHRLPTTLGGGVLLALVISINAAVAFAQPAQPRASQADGTDALEFAGATARSGRLQTRL